MTHRIKLQVRCHRHIPAAQPQDLWATSRADADWCDGLPTQCRAASGAGGGVIPVGGKPLPV